MDDVDIDSAEFKSLPAEVQHEILSELKERRKRLTRYSNLKLPKVYLLFFLNRCFLGEKYMYVNLSTGNNNYYC